LHNPLNYSRRKWSYNSTRRKWSCNWPKFNPQQAKIEYATAKRESKLCLSRV